MTSSSPATGPSSVEAVVAELHRYEALLRDTHIAGCGLAMALRTAQRDVGLSPLAGHRIFAKLDEAQLQVSSALTTTAHGHALIRAIAPIIGIDPTAYGEGTDPEEEFARPRGHVEQGPNAHRA